MNPAADKGKIRVLIVEDSPLIARILSTIIHETEDIEVIGIATNGKKAVEMTAQLKPDIVTMDINLPIMNGYEATKHIMGYTPTPILVVSSTDYATEMSMTFNAISYGALDMIEKGRLQTGERGTEFEEQFLEKLRLLSRVKVISHPMARLENIHAGHTAGATTPSKLRTFIVGIAASTGGPQAIHCVLNRLPEKVNFCILIVQHIVPSFTEGFANWLHAETRRDVRIGSEGSEILPNVVYVAPGDAHMKVTPYGTLSINREPPYKGHRPSANIMFKSIAEIAGTQSLGVVLSGMGSDGLEGLQAMQKKRAAIVAQDEQSCVVYGMPRVAIEAGIVTAIAASSGVAREIMRLYSQTTGET